MLNFKILNCFSYSLIFKMYKMNKLKFPQFDTLKVSTRTFTAMTNIDINISKLFDFLPVSDYIVIPKKRGRKRKGKVVDLNKDIKFGSIVTIKYFNQIRGVELKPKKKGTKKCFRNSVTIVAIFDKAINFKVSKNGTFQITGCKNIEHAELCVKCIWEHVKNNQELYTLRYGTSLEALVIPVMRNINFSLGFLVDREKLNIYLNTNEKFHCLLETSFGHTGVNIKIPLDKDISTMNISKITSDSNKSMISSWKHEDSIFQEYLEYLKPKHRKAKLEDVKYNTFLVFQSGKVIMTGINEEYMRDVYEFFIEIMRECYDFIEERLEN